MINWQPFVTSAANMLKDEPGATPSDVASDVFRPSPDEEVREMLTAMRNSDPDLDGIIAATAAQEGVDPDALADFFYSGLDATEEYMDEDDEDEPLSYLDDDSAEDEDDDK